MDDGRHFPFENGFDANEGGAETSEPSSQNPHRSSDVAASRVAHLTPRARSQPDPAAGAIPPRSRGTAELYRVPEAKNVSTRGPDLEDLRPFADQLMAIAQRLRSGDFSQGLGVVDALGLSQDGRSGKPTGSNLHPNAKDGHSPTPTDTLAERTLYANMARAAYAKRRKRGSLFGDLELFGEPAWDILLDLYIAHTEGKSVSVSSACIGSASPPTTGLRWLGVLSEHGFVAREHDPQDQRRVLVRLTQKAIKAMDAYFANSASAQGDARTNWV